MGIPMKTGWITLLVLCTASVVRAQDLPYGPVSLANGMVVIGTDLSISLTPQDDTDGAWFNYTDYEHNALRLFRVALNADVRLTDRVSVLTEIRSENGDEVKPYALYVRVRPWRDRPIDIQAGRIPPTFGAFARRDYGAGNPLIGYPLAYQYLTAVRPDALPASTDDVVRMRARGWRPSYPIGSLDIAPGMPLITTFRWDTGVQVRVGPESINASAAVTNGTTSDPRTRDNNGGKQIAGRLHWRPSAALAIGGSAASGAYVADAALANATMIGGTSRSKQQAFGLDAEYSRDHWMVSGEFIWNPWQVPPHSAPLAATSAFVEGRYQISPGIFVASRIDHLGFNELASSFGTRTWDAPITRLETGVGYYIRRNLLAKGTYQHNWRDGGIVTSRGLFAAQLHFWL
jgi:opacity protein-like surface antigen